MSYLFQFDGHLFQVDEHGAYRYSDPETSKEAALAVKVNRLEQLFVEQLAKYPEGLTAFQVSILCDVPLNSISPRTAPLKRKGKIYDSGERRDGKIVWKLR